VLFIVFLSMSHHAVAGSCDWLAPSNFHKNAVLSAEVDTEMFSRPTAQCPRSDLNLQEGESFTHIATTGDFFYGQNASGNWGWVHKVSFEEPKDNDDLNSGSCEWLSPSEFHTNTVLSAEVDSEMFGRPTFNCPRTDRQLYAGGSFKHIATTGDFFYGQISSGVWGWAHKSSFEDPISEPTDDDNQNPVSCDWTTPFEFHTNAVLSANVDSEMFTRPTSACIANDRSLRAGESFKHIATSGEFFYGQNAVGLWAWVHRSTFDDTPVKNPTECFTDDGHIVASPGTCVGVPVDVKLVDYRSGMTDTSIITIPDSNITIEGKRFIGCVRLTGDNVTFKNNYVECYRSRDNLRSASAYSGSGPVMATGKGTTIEYNTLVCKMRNLDDTACDYGVFSGSSIVRFNDISGSVDGVDVRVGAQVQYNYIHDFGVAYEEWREKAYPTERTHYSHADGVQLYAEGAGEILIEGNFFKGLSQEPDNLRYEGLQGMLLAATGDSKPNVRIANNLISGFWPSLRIACMNGTTCQIDDNKINARYNGNNSAAINLGGAHPSTSVRCNRFTDDQFVENDDVWQGYADNSDC